MKILNDYEKFNEARVNTKKLTYPIAGKAWNDLWKKKNFKWLPPTPDIIIKLENDEENGFGVIEVLKHGSNNGYPGYQSLGKKSFRPIDDERDMFFDWLKELNLIEK